MLLWSGGAFTNAGTYERKVDKEKTVRIRYL